MMAVVAIIWASMGGAAHTWSWLDAVLVLGCWPLDVQEVKKRKFFVICGLSGQQMEMWGDHTVKCGGPQHVRSKHLLYHGSYGMYVRYDIVWK